MVPFGSLKKNACLRRLELNKNVLDYVSSFREHLHHACQMTHENLSQPQSKMKRQYDKKSVAFQPGVKVLVLLPLPGSSLHDQFSSPYVVE